MKTIFKSLIYGMVAASMLTVTTSCNDEWEDEQYAQYISFRAPLNDQGITAVYVPFTRKNSDGTNKYGPGISNYQLPVIVSGSTHNSATRVVNFKHDPDTLDALNWARFATRTELYYKDMNPYCTFPSTLTIPKGEDVGLLDIKIDFNNLDLVDKWIFPITVAEGDGYVPNPRKNYKKAMLRIFPFNDYSGDYSATGLTIAVTGDQNSTGLTWLRTYVVDDNTVFFYAGRFDESNPQRGNYKIYARFEGGTSGTIKMWTDNPLMNLVVNKDASFRMIESEDQTYPYLRYRNVIINNIDYSFDDYTSLKGSKFSYTVSGTLTLQRTINTQIPDEDQAIQW